MNNETEHRQGTFQPDFSDPEYRRLLEAIKKDANGLNSLSLVDISTGDIDAPPDERQIEQALFACSLFGSDAVNNADLKRSRDVPELASFRIGDFHLVAVPLRQARRSCLAILVMQDHVHVDRLKTAFASIQAELEEEGFSAVLGSKALVLRGWLLGTEPVELLDTHVREGSAGSGKLKRIDALDPVNDLYPMVTAIENPVAGESRDWLDGVTAVFEGTVWRWVRIPFIERYVLFADSSMWADDKVIIKAMITAQNDILRKAIADILASGLRTHVEPFPETDQDFAQLVRILRQLDAHDLWGRLVEGGFANSPQDFDGVRMRCQECIYFLPNRRWCDLPELPIPVEPDWFCRLWRM